ncbi:methyl-accepting chemotaxis protein [Cohnella hashimotonis]|uniref:Methyl-accepting chemotaxis protein n=1 Tax=Cohnella hashimotonis TaxID=2826895 RepID=A0ABT6TTS7_9BACL|nr:methyl-accepting chemotaxis protein [Cohnella hashimotonis]MDI4649921.1 methyl-accepting chemotaxis protein [Cohnella hashimotonis]
MDERGQYEDNTQVLDAGAVLGAMERSLAMIEFDMEGVTLWANRKFADALGYNQAEMRGLPHRRFCTPSFAASDAYRELWTNLRSGKAFQEKIQRVAKDGRLLWLEATYMPVRGADGTYDAVIKIATDITSREQAAIQHTEELKRTAQELSNRAGEGISRSGEIEAAIEKLRADSLENFDRLQRLERQTAAIRGIVRVIREVASQTQLLSLNAAIEAAHAGEFGRGFEIVASEVRKLAGEVQEAAKKANAEVEEVVSRMAEIGSGTKRSQSSVEESQRRLQDAIVAFRKIEDAAYRLEEQAKTLDRA